MRKAKSKIAVAMLTVLAMVFTMVPAMAFAAETVTSVKVTFSAATGEGFDMTPQELTVADNLTETYYPGVTVEPKGKVTVSDVLVAAHIAKYGSKFTSNPKEYYNVENGSYQSGSVTKQFGHQYVGLYYINGASTDLGVCLCTVNANDVVETGSYSDNTYADLYSHFDKKAYTANVGEPIKVKLTADNWKKPVVPSSGAKIMTADPNTGKLTETGKVTDANGEASISFSKGGTYIISATGKVTYEGYNGTVTGSMIAPWAKVVVNAVPVPNKVTAKSAGLTSVKVSWSKVSGVGGYEVYRATSLNGTYKNVKTTSAASFTNKNLKTGKAYYYKVRAYKTVNGSKYYSEFSSKAKASARPAAPALKVKAGKKNVKVSWKKVAGANGYQVYRAKSKNGKFAKIKTVTKKTTSYKNMKLKKGKKYYYKVRAYKKVSGKKVYGTYSKVKMAKAK